MAMTVEIVTKGDREYISTQDLVSYLADEVAYAIEKGGETNLSSEYLAGLVFGLSQVMKNINSIGR